MTPESQYTYKAFISYSHAADGRLAPALQAGLHRFAKPWYRLRAMRVFRDETTLATSPELWPSIESALEQSEFFLFLASPEAAQSYWVQKEFEHWLGRRSKDQMLIVLTDGELVWDRDAGDFDWSKTTAVPRGIEHKFEGEPLYLDLRWAKTQEDLSLGNPKFRSAIADVASTLMGRPKDELIGEDVRRHRQTRRITWSAVVTLVVLTAASIIAAVTAVRNQEIAEERGAIALSRQLAAQAVSLAGTDRGDLALLLSLEALNVRPTVDAKNSLLTAITRDPRRRFHLHGHMGEITSLAFAADGRELLSLGCEGIGTLGLCKHYGVRRWDAVSGEPKGQVIIQGARRWTVLDESAATESLVARSRNGKEWDPVSGRSLGRTSVSGRLSPDGEILVKRSGGELKLSRMNPRRQLDVSLRGGSESIRSVAFHPTAPLIAIGGSKGDLQLWNTNELANGSEVPLRTFDIHSNAVIDLDFSPDGRYLVSAGWDDLVLAWEVNSENPPLQLSEGTRVSSVDFSRDGRRLVIAKSIGERGGELQLWDAEHWQLIMTFAGQAPVALHPNGKLLATAGNDGAIIVRDLDQDRPLARTLEDPGDPMSLAFLNGSRFVVVGGRDQTLRIWDVESGKLERPPIPTGQGWILAIAAHPDGKQILSGGQDGSILAWDLLKHTETRSMLVGRHDGPVGALDFSTDGSYLVSGGYDKMLRLWQIGAASEPLGNPPIQTGHDVYAVQFDRSDSRVAVATEDGSVLIWPLTGDSATASVVGTHVLEFDGMTGLAFGPQDRFLVSSSPQQMQLWSLEPGETVVSPPIDGSYATLHPSGELAALVTDGDEIQLVDLRAWRTFDAMLGQHKRSVSALAFSSDGLHLAAAAKGDIVLWDVDVESWRTRACAIARRNFTIEEWNRYLGEQPYQKSCPDAGSPPKIPLDAKRALGLAVRSFKLGESSEARQLFAEAALLAAAGDDAKLVNEVCWFGAPRGASAEVMVACERAVELESEHASYRDRRGIARAETGDIAGAIEDFRFYVASIEDSDRRSRRQAWIKSLESGADPFNSMELYLIRSEGGF